MQGKHYALIAAVLASIASMGATAKEWSDILTPQFVFGAMGAIASTIGGMYMQRPNEPPK